MAGAREYLLPGLVLILWHTLESAMNAIAKKVRVPDLALMKQRGERHRHSGTAYDATMARLFDQSRDCRSAAGRRFPWPCHSRIGFNHRETLEKIIHHSRVPLRQGASRASWWLTCPFLSISGVPRRCDALLPCQAFSGGRRGSGSET